MHPLDGHSLHQETCISLPPKADNLKELSKSCFHHILVGNIFPLLHKRVSFWFCAPCSQSPPGLYTFKVTKPQLRCNSKSKKKQFPNDKTSKQKDCLPPATATTWPWIKGNLWMTTSLSPSRTKGSSLDQIAPTGVISSSFTSSKKLEPCTEIPVT